MKILNLEIANCGECPLSYIDHTSHGVDYREDEAICKLTGSSIRKKDEDDVFFIYFETIEKLRRYNYTNTDCPLASTKKERKVKSIKVVSSPRPDTLKQEKKAANKFYYEQLDRVLHAVDLPGSPSIDKCVDRAIELINIALKKE